MPTDPPPIARCRLVFAVWHWPRWAWVVVVVLVPVIYFLMAAPVIALAEWGIGAPYSDPEITVPIYELVKTFFRLATYCAQHCEILEWVMEWEWFAMDVVLFHRPLSDTPRDFEGS